MQSFSSFTAEQIDIDLPDDDDELEQLNEINLKRAIAPAIALSFALRKSKEVRQKLVNAMLIKADKRLLIEQRLTSSTQN